MNLNMIAYLSFYELYNASQEGGDFALFKNSFFYDFRRLKNNERTKWIFVGTYKVFWDVFLL